MKHRLKILVMPPYVDPITGKVQYKFYDTQPIEVDNDTKYTVQVFSEYVVDNLSEETPDIPVELSIGAPFISISEGE